MVNMPDSEIYIGLLSEFLDGAKKRNGIIKNSTLLSFMKYMLTK